MGAYSRTYSFTDGTTAYGSQVAFELDALGSSVNNIVNAQISASAAIADTKLAQIATASKVSGAALTSLASIPSGAGVVPVANLGSGSPASTTFLRGDGAWTTGPDYTLVQSGSPSAAASFTISSLVAGAKYRLVLKLTQNTSTGSLTMRVNADSGANYKYYGSYGASAVNSNTDTSFAIFLPTGLKAATDFFSEIIFQPASSTNNDTQVLYRTVGNYAGDSLYYALHGGGHYDGSAAASSVTILTSGGTMTGTWALYLIN